MYTDSEVLASPNMGGRPTVLSLPDLRRRHYTNILGLLMCAFDVRLYENSVDLYEVKYYNRVR